MGPFDTFASFPTAHVTPATLVTAAPDVTPQSYRALITQDMNAIWKVMPEVADRILGALEPGPMTVGDLAAATAVRPPP